MKLNVGCELLTDYMMMEEVFSKAKSTQQHISCTLIDERDLSDAEESDGCEAVIASVKYRVPNMRNEASQTRIAILLNRPSTYP